MFFFLLGSSFIISLFYKMNSPTNWEIFKQDQNKILWGHICNEELTRIAISLNNWW